MIAPHQSNGRQITAALPSSARRVAEDSERRTIEHESENAPRQTEFRRLNWEMVAIWSFVVASFAALLFCGFIIWVKCHGARPF